jgi:hypothetical protein
MQCQRRNPCWCTDATDRKEDFGTKKKRRKELFVKGGLVTCGGTKIVTT